MDPFLRWARENQPDRVRAQEIDRCPRAVVRTVARWKPQRESIEPVVGELGDVGVQVLVQQRAATLHEDRLAAEVFLNRCQRTGKT